MPSERIDPLLDSLTVVLSQPEVDLLQDAVAGWLAHYLMRDGERMDGEPADGFDFQTMTVIGNKIGMNL